MQAEIRELRTWVGLEQALKSALEELLLFLKNTAMKKLILCKISKRATD